MEQKTGVYLGEEGSTERQILGLLIGRAYQRWKESEIQMSHPYGSLLTKIQQDPDYSSVQLLTHKETKLLLSTLIDTLVRPGYFSPGESLT